MNKLSRHIGKCLFSLIFALLWIPAVSAQETSDSIKGLQWCYHIGHANADYWDYYQLSGRKYYRGHFYHVMYLKRIIPMVALDNFSLKNICIREDQGKVYVMKNEYLDLMGDYSTWNNVGDATYLPYEETEEGELVLYDYNMQPGDRFSHVSRGRRF